MAGGIYLRHGEDFVAMREQAYQTEDLLQALLAEHPEILAGDDENNGRGWLLVRREAGVSDSAAGASRWFLDHLFLDREGVPTLVEVKRSSDTRARREVVAQMLDYAANAVAYWNVTSVQAWFEAECEQRQVEPGVVLAEHFGVNDEDAYWAAVGAHLASDRIRLVFVSDEVSPELRSIVEYLNRQMTDTEVLAIEVKQYIDADGTRQTIVPRVLGQTAAAKVAKAGGGRVTRRWDEASVLSELAELHGAAIAEAARQLLTWAKAQRGVEIRWGRGARAGVAIVGLTGEVALWAFNIYTYGVVEIPFDYMRNSAQAPFATSREVRDELRRRINEAVPEAKLPSEEERIRPSFSLSALAGESEREGFFEAMTWAFSKAREAQRSASLA